MHEEILKKRAEENEIDEKAEELKRKRQQRLADHKANQERNKIMK